MKKILLLFFICAIAACQSTQQDRQQELQAQIDSLKKSAAENYKPGFGEFMSCIQAHHTKLWFAGQNQNWKLADFEVHEIMEAIEDIQKFQPERPESKQIGMINFALDSINESIRLEDPEKFKRSFVLLTNTCNNCHRATKFEFNKVVIPETSPFPNQDFRK